jgi:hypothetical protein
MANDRKLRFEAEVSTVGPMTLILLPEHISAKLPSRGMVMVKGSVNGTLFQTPLEPDGRGSHWLNLDKNLRKQIDADAGDTVHMEIESTKDWPEPEVPADVVGALKSDDRANTLWADITPMARWDWLRWIASTGRSETRKRRIEVALSKLKAGNRRPCCFNRTMCTVPSVSKNGVLLKPAG